ncbi:MAG TPA: tellurite resistance TerB C-terminal domain-containing protein [Tepidisphaeraceae bacterium]
MTAIDWFARHERPLPPAAAFVVAREQERSRKGIVFQRVPKQVQSLFRRRYQLQYGAGLRLARIHEQQTRGHSAEYAFEPLVQLWNQCVGDLQRWSLIVSRNSASPKSAEAWDALPADLQEIVEHPAMPKVQAWLAGRKTQFEATAADAARLLGIEENTGLTKRHLRKLDALLSHAGWRLETSKLDVHSDADQKLTLIRGAAGVEDAVRLNPREVATVLGETRQVQAILSSALKDDDLRGTAADGGVEPSQDPQAAPPTTSGVPQTPSVPPARFARLYHELRRKSAWPVQEVRALARQYGHMLDGAIEVLNDWWFERTGTPLLIEYDARFVVASEA